MRTGLHLLRAARLYVEVRGKSMPEFFNKMSFKKKLLSSYIFFIGISCVLMGTYFLKSMKSTTEECYSYMSQFSEQVSMSIDVIVSNMDRIRFLNFTDENVRDIIKKSPEEKTKDEILDDEAYMEQALNLVTKMNQYVLRATIINESGEVYSNVKTNNEEYLQKMSRIDKMQNWSDKNKVYYTSAYKEEIYLIPFELVTSISKIYDITQEESVATLYIDLNFSSICQMLDQQAKSKETGTKLLIFDENQNLIYNSEGNEQNFWNEMTSSDCKEIQSLLKQEKPTKRGIRIYGKNSLVAEYKNKTTNWRIVSWTSMKSIYASAWKNMFGIFIAMVLLLVFAVFLGAYLAGQISRPIMILADTMKMVENGKVSLIEGEEEWKDEMGILLHSYNEMGKRINDSIEKIL